MSPPRGLTEEESAAWERLAATAVPLHPRTPPAVLQPAVEQIDPAPRPSTSRKAIVAAVTPDFTLDLHGYNLDAAYTRLIGGVAQARAMGARTILLITGKSRPVDPADRATKRGAIRAKVLDWLAASSHHSAIAAIRNAHRRHGGDGALIIVLRKSR
ncbi:MAG: DNA mismatch repair protein MutS [Citromicrobium sp.]|nr:MAG: DNA mismatch repair protein MutS [Citromicrobium sp.]